MKKIRIGNDIVIKWRITVNGEEFNLEGLDLSLYISTTYQPRKAIAFTVAGNEITATFKGTDQNVTGVYRLTLYRNEGENSQSILDACDAFELVSCSCLTVDAAFGGAEVELPIADLGVGIPGLSAYEIAVSEGFVGTQAEWLASLSAASEAAAAECREVIAEFSQAEDSRVTAEAQRVANENSRIAGEGSRVEAENDRAAAEQLRATAESKRDAAELARIANESNRVSAEGARSSAEELRKSNEQSRISEETTRSNNEAARAAAEESRVAAEQSRQSAEADRLTNEHSRVATESQRVTNETARKDAEDARVANEAARQSAEATRQSNEQSRQTAEQGRVTAEEARATTEQQRADAEAARVEAEQARAEEFAGFTATLAAKEDAANKVTSINADATDLQYPSAKAVWSAIEDKFWYGIEKDTTVSTPTCTRIGNMDYHRTLPVQSLMRGCLLADDGTVNKYLDPDDWTNEVRDGSQGQVMVEIPRHYRKCETDGNIIRVKLSLLPLEGFHEVPKMYVSAYEAALERSTDKLCSVVNDGTNYRGGNNNANYDGTYRSFLGRPVTEISRTTFRNYARKRKNGSTEWNCYTYDIHKTLFWLFVIEYATLNSQAAFNSEPTSEGYRQGGLGAGVTTWDDTWGTFNGYYPIVPCGHTDSLGNRTGVVSYTAKNDDESITKTFDVPRYRGVENPFGHIWKWTDGCNIQVSATQENGGTGLSKAFICHDPANFQDSNYANYSHVGNIDRAGGYVKEVLFGLGGEILPKVAGGGSTTYFCDNHYTNIPTSGEALRGLLFGGHAITSATAGLACAYSNTAPKLTNTHIGSRLCFIPQK